MPGSTEDATLAGDEALRTAPAGQASEGWLLPGAPVGRYMVLSRLGAGGMGVVYAAYDPELDRKVALKLLRPTPGSREQTRDRDRRLLKQEAQALAKLAHPNVVTVHDVGEHEGRVFLAMEFVDGETLSEWRKRERTTAEVLSLMLRAGEGLHAAHLQGLVHRDFKPDNVMVGRDGRVRVMDFGLARETTSGDRGDAGGMVGTPAYMAPEQFTGVQVDARCDQFSFCVTLWESLFGERPYEGASLAELVVNVQSGTRAEPLATKWNKVAPWVRQAMLRGLEAEPDDRWPSMEALLRELSRQPESRRWLGIGIGGAAIATALWAGLAPHDEGGPRCDAPGPTVDEAWDDTRRGAVEQALRATEVPHAAATWERVRDGLDAYGEAWTGVRHQLCQQPPGDNLDAERALCLDRRKRALRSLAEVLAEADAKVVDEAVDLVALLPEPERCLDVAYVSAEVEPPDDPEVAARVEALRDTLARVHALEAAGKTDAARKSLEPLLDEATALDYPPLHAEALQALGAIESEEGHGEAAATTLTKAYEQAVELGMDELAASTARTLVVELGDRQARAEEGLAWLPSARALAARAELGPRFEADLLTKRANVHLARGSLDDAARDFEAALERFEELDGPDGFSVYAASLGLGSVQAQRGELDRARVLMERALGLAEKALGPDHPDVAAILLNLGNLQFQGGDLQKARELYERSLAIAEAARGPDHPQLCLVLSNLGNVAQQLGQLELAEQRFERAAEIAEASGGPTHPNVALALTNLANVKMAQRDFEAAERVGRRAVDIWVERLGEEPEHPHAAAALNNLANAVALRDRHREALPLLERSVRIWEKVMGPDSAALIDPLRGLAVSHYALGEPAPGLAAAERARTLQQAAKIEGMEAAVGEYLVARGLWELHPDQRDAALGTVRRSRALIEASEPSRPRTASLDAIDEWLAQVGADAPTPASP